MANADAAVDALRAARDAGAGHELLIEDRMFTVELWSLRIMALVHVAQIKIAPQPCLILFTVTRLPVQPCWKTGYTSGYSFSSSEGDSAAADVAP